MRDKKKIEKIVKLICVIDSINFRYTCIIKDCMFLKIN